MGTVPRVDLGHLPASASHFLGRKTELAALEAAWSGGAGAGIAVVELVAPGVTGKTALVGRWLDGLVRRGRGCGEAAPGSADLQSAPARSAGIFLGSTRASGLERTPIAA